MGIKDILEACGRAHDLDEVYSAVQAVREARSSGRLRSWSLDLISGLPRMDLAGWRHSLEQAVMAGPDHISVYDLQVWNECEAQDPYPFGWKQ